MRYNLPYLGMFLLRGLASEIVFDPVTAGAALLDAREPPTALFARAMPMTLVFLFCMSTLLSLLYGLAVFLGLERRMMTR